jgi:hypothetical protein
MALAQFPRLGAQREEGQGKRCNGDDSRPHRASLTF